MACVGHLVTEATIGREDDLGLDSSFGYSKWRAMIIKDNEGDWALCAAAWKGMKAGTSFKSFYRLPLGKKPVRERQAHFCFFFFLGYLCCPSCFAAFYAVLCYDCKK